MDQKFRGFSDRFLAKIGKIDRRHIRAYMAQLLSQKQFLETIFDNLNEAIIVTDPTLRIVYSNEMSRRMLFRHRRKDYFGEDLVELAPEGELHDLFAGMRQRPRAIHAYECAFGKQDDRRMAVTSLPVRVPIQSEPGEAEEDDSPPPEREGETELMWVFLAQDVTERRRILDEQSRSQRLASLALLTSGVAHEIKNPLNSLNIHAQILQSAAEAGEGGAIDREKVRRAAGVILEETERLTTIVNEFIQAARPQSAVMERHSINRIVEDLLRLFRPECEAEGIELSADLDADLPPIELDAHLMFQALRNLVRNAIEAHQQSDEIIDASEKEELFEQKPKERRILIRTKLAGDFAAIEVADNGPGIPEDKIDKIFEPYYTTKFSGTGLGLMVVYRIVAQHRGTIHVDSRPGVGSRVIVSLPLAERPVRLLDDPTLHPLAKVER